MFGAAGSSPITVETLRDFVPLSFRVSVVRFNSVNWALKSVNYPSTSAVMVQTISTIKVSDLPVVFIIRKLILGPKTFFHPTLGRLILSFRTKFR